jgi:ribose transport system ATP-binding protein
VGSPSTERESAAARDGASHESALGIESLSMAFSDRTVLHEFSLLVEQGEIHALIGQNGSGKSTLIKILSGFHLPLAGGYCTVGGEPLSFGDPESSYRLGLRFVHQDLALVASSSILDNLMLNRGYPTRAGTIRRRAAVRSARRDLAAVGLDLDPLQLVSALTPAQRTGVAIARAMHGRDRGEPPVALVLDEPTATLPAPEVLHLHAMLRAAAASGIGVLYVTHHLDELAGFADRVSVLRDGRLVSTSSMAETSHDAIVRAMVGGSFEALMERADLPATSNSDKAPILVAEHLSGGSIEDVSLAVRGGEIVGVHGLTGSGREALLAMIFGAIDCAGGSVVVHGRTIPRRRPDLAIRAGVAYVPPDRKISGGIMTQSARENFTLPRLKPYWSHGHLKRRAEETDVKGWFQRLGVKPQDAIEAPLTTYSGGNQQKIVLGKWLRLKPSLLLLDDPTQGVDVAAKADLHRLILALAAEGVAVLLGSTDADELASLSSRVLVLRRGRIASELHGEQISEGALNDALHRGTADANRNEHP